jgi:hypothetical protein
MGNAAGAVRSPARHTATATDVPCVALSTHAFDRKQVVRHGGFSDFAISPLFALREYRSSSMNRDLVWARDGDERENACSRNSESTTETLLEISPYFLGKEGP